MAAGQLGAERDDPLWALARAGVLAELEAGMAVVVVGEGEEDTTEGLGQLGAAVGGPGDEVRPLLLVLGVAAAAALEDGLAAAHRAGCRYVYTRRPEACQLARRWYWCHQVPAASAPLGLGEVWSQASGSQPSLCHNRYGHWVGWRRLLPDDQGSAGSVPAPPPAP